MTDRYQTLGCEIMYDAMIVLRMLNPGRYNRFQGASDLPDEQLLTINHVIGDGLHNVPEILVADLSEAERGKALRRELLILQDQISGLNLSDQMPTPWRRFTSLISNVIATVGADSEGRGRR